MVFRASTLGRLDVIMNDDLRVSIQISVAFLLAFLPFTGKLSDSLISTAACRYLPILGASFLYQYSTILLFHASCYDQGQATALIRKI